MEDKKKKTTTKKTSKTSTSAKKAAPKKTVAKKTNVTPAKKVTPKKTVAKKVEEETPKKVASKKTTTKKVTKKTTPKVEVKEVEKEEVKTISKEDILEKTYVFNKKEQENLSEVVEEMKKTKSPSYENIGKLDKENKKIILCLTLAIVLVVVGCLVYVIFNLEREESLDVKSYIDDSTYKNIDSYDDAEEGSSSKSFKDADYSNIINTNIDDFEVKVAEGKDMIVVISSDTCFYCVTFEPILNEVLVAKKGEAIRLNITNMNTKETDRLRNYYAFNAAPTLLYIENGEVVADFEGYMDKDTLSTWYDENIKK